MFRYLFLLTVLLSSCVSAQVSDRDRFGELPLPPLNGRNAPGSKPAEKDFQRVPDPGSAPVALFSTDGIPFLGEFAGRANVVIQERCLSFKDEKLPNQVCLAIPDGMNLGSGTFSNVQTSLRALSGLEGKDEHLYLTTESGKELAFGYHFEVTDKAQAIEFPDLPPLRQKEVSPNQEQNFKAVPVLITTDDGEEELKLGAVQTVRFKGGNYQIFLHTSVWQADGGSCGDGGYILRVLYLRDNRA